MAFDGYCIPAENIYAYAMGGDKTWVTREMVDFALGNNTNDRENIHHDLWVPGEGIKRHYARYARKDKFLMCYYYTPPDKDVVRHPPGRFVM